MGSVKDKNKINEIVSKLQKKHIKTDIDYVALEYKKSLFTISEILVSHNKGHISDEGLVEEIKVVLREVL